jgi:hypothetical protein
MRTALYLSRATARRSWRAALAVALIGGLLGAVALGALAGARRTASAYDRYLASINASDAFVNVPGPVPGMPATRPATLIAGLPGVAASAAYVGLDAYPVVHGHVDDGYLTADLVGSLTGAYFRQDRMTVLAGRLPRLGATREIALSPSIGAGVPLGIAAGRWAWGTFAGSLGVYPVTVVPVLLLAAGAAVVMLTGNLLAAVPAVVAHRTDPAAALRSE